MEGESNWTKADAVRVKSITPQAEAELRTGDLCLARQGAGSTEPSTMLRCSFKKFHAGLHSWDKNLRLDQALPDAEVEVVYGTTDEMKED